MRIEEKNGNLVITDFNELEAYKIACKIEADGIHFYKRLLDAITEDKSRNSLGFLLKEEVKHLDYFNKQLFRISEEEGETFEGDDLLSSMNYGIFQPYESMSSLSKILDNPKKALHLGIIIEEKSIGFYEKIRDKVSGDKTKTEVSNIIKEEIKHKKLLEEMAGR